LETVGITASAALLYRTFTENWRWIRTCEQVLGDAGDTQTSMLYIGDLCPSGNTIINLFTKCCAYNHYSYPCDFFRLNACNQRHGNYYQNSRMIRGMTTGRLLWPIETCKYCIGPAAQTVRYVDLSHGRDRRPHLKNL
jgi:hypothetical protein